MAKNFSKLMIDTKLKIYEVHRTLYRINIKKTILYYMSHHIIL